MKKVNLFLLIGIILGIIVPYYLFTKDNINIFWNRFDGTKLFSTNNGLSWVRVTKPLKFPSIRIFYNRYDGTNLLSSDGGFSWVMINKNSISEFKIKNNTNMSSTSWIGFCEAKVELFDLQGNKVIEDMAKFDELTEYLKLKRIRNGCYLIKVESTNGSFIEKIMLNK